MHKQALYLLTILATLLSITLQGQTAHAAADIKPSIFLSTPAVAPARGDVLYSVVVTSMESGSPVTNGWLEVPVPAGFTFLSVTDAGCHYSGATPSLGAPSDKIRCDWSTITDHQNVDFHLRVPDATAVYTLTATTGADNNSDPNNDLLDTHTQVVQSADLQLTKTGTPNPAPGGSIVTYDFTVHNAGPYDASVLTLTDTLPSGLTFVGDNASPTADQDANWSCAAVGQVVTCTASSLANGATSLFHFRVRVTKATTGTITNAASVSATTPEPIPDDNTSSHNLTVTTGTDMAIAKSVATNPVIGGQPVHFNLTATNNGPMTADTVEVHDTLPSGYTDIAMLSSPVGWNCTIDDISDPPTITCTIASVASGASAVFSITATPPTVTDTVTHQNSAQVSTTTTDPVSSNDNVTVNYTVNPDIADLSITKTKTPDPVAQGSDMTSTIVVHNSGPRPADPVEVVDVLSADETFKSYSGTGWTCAHTGGDPGGTVTCSYSAVPLANGANTVPLNIITTATSAGALTNTACTGGSGGSGSPGFGDTNTGNNCSNGSVTSTTEQADLEVNKATSDSTIDPTENSFTYTVTIHNKLGSDTAQDVDFRDTIPQYVAAGPAGSGRPATSLSYSTSTLHSATPGYITGCTISDAQVQCNLGDLINDETATVTITVTRPMRDGTLTNTASAYSLLTGDPDRSNNESHVDVTVDPVTDVEVTEKLVTYAGYPTDPILAGTIATYTIGVRNNGPSTAASVTLADVFSGEAFDFIDASVAGGGSCTYDTPTTTLNCTLADMAADTTKAITVHIRPDHNVTPVGAWQIDNTATASTATTESNASNNSQDAHLPIALGVADLSITKNEAVGFTEPVRFDPSTPGTNLIVYKIDIANSGPSLATGVQFTDNVTGVAPLQSPAQKLTFVRDTANADGSASGSNICDNIGTTFDANAAPTITCQLSSDATTSGGQLASGASYTRYIVFQVLNAPDPTIGDTYTDVAKVSANETEPTDANNTEGETTTVRTVADLELLKTFSKSPVEVDEAFSYTLTVTNYGPGKSPSTSVTDTLPSGMVLTGAPTTAFPGGSCTGSAGSTSFTCDLGLMNEPTGSPLVPVTATITVPVKVTTWPSSGVITNHTRPIQNCGTVTGLAPEPNPNTTHPNNGCVDVAVSQPATLGDKVWLDRNANGIQDGGEPGINGVVVKLLNSAGNPVLDSDGNPVTATTATVLGITGIYSFTINHAASYIVEFVKPASYVASPKDVAGTEATDSDADTTTGRTDAIAVNYGDAITTVDAGFYQQVSVGDRVWEDRNADGTQTAGEPGSPGVTVNLLNSSLTQIATTTTNAAGNYLFSALTPGNYSVQITPPAWIGYLPSPVQTLDPNTNSNTDSNIASTVSPGVYRSGVITLSSGSEPTTDGDNSNGNLTLDFGLVTPARVGNYVWLDENSDGIQDAGEPGLANVTVQLKNNAGTVLATTITDSHGGYLFKGLAPGNYYLQVLSTSLPAGMTQTTTYTNPGTDFGNQDQSSVNGYSVHLTSGGENLTADFGYNWSPTADVTGGTGNGAIGDRVWIDHNGDGIQDPGETGIDGVELTLYSAGPDGLFWTADDVIVATTTTNADGSYIFDNLPAGAYTVQVTGSSTASHDILASSNYTQTGDPDHFAANMATAPAGTAGDNKSTIPVILAPGDTFVNVDFGYQPQSGASLHAIGDTVWLDMNRDGIQDPSESGIQGVVFGLQNADGDFIATTTTNASGQYLFTDLPDGNYTVVVIDSDNVMANFNPTYDQDSGTTNPDEKSSLLLNGADNLAQDFGYTPNGPNTGTSAIGDLIFLDRNNNGTFDAGEGLEGIRVSLISGGNVIAVTYTNEYGRYFFAGLTAGTYTVTVDTTTLPAGVNNTLDPDGGTASTSTLTIGANEINMLQDFGYVAASPGTIGNLLWKDTNADGIYQPDGMDGIPGTADDESALAGVTLDLYRDLNNNHRIDADEPLIASTTTDINGSYLFEGLPGGNYNVKVSDRNHRLTGFWHSRGADSINNQSQADYYALTLAGGGSILTADFGYYFQPGTVGNRVWKDVDANGLYDQATDTALAGVTVNLSILYPNGTTTTVKTVTDSNGLYAFHNLLLDENHNGISATNYGTGGDEPLHTVSIDTAASATPLGTLAPIYPTRTLNTDTTTVGGAASDEDTADIGSDSPTGEPAYPPMGSSDLTNDFGYFQPGSIGDTIWNDANNNGLVDLGGEGLAGVTVRLTPPAGVNLGAGVGTAITTTTDVNGNYLFTGLPPGSYTVAVVESSLPAVLQGHNTVDPNGGNDSTSTLTLTVGENNLAQDFAYFVSCSIGNFVWDDSNGNGIQDPGETGHQGISVHLLDGSGNVVNDPAHPGTPYVLLTDSNGGYLFSGLLPGTYQVQFVLPANNSFTSQFSGGNPALDSNPDFSGTVSVTLGASEANTTIDAGLLGAGIHLEKSTNGQDADTPPGPSVQIGDLITWSYVVSNTGSVPLTNVAVTDNQGVIVTCPGNTLAEGASMTCTGSGIAVAGQYANIGTAVGTPPSGPAVVATDPSHYLAGNSTAPAIAIKKYTNGQDADTAPGPVITVGNPVTWTYVVTNIGNADLTGVAVTDDKIGSITCPQSSLSIGASMTCTATGVAVSGQYSNTGSVTGTPPSGPPVTDTDPSHYFGSTAGINEAAIHLEKATNGVDADTAPGPYIETGHAITWSYTVTNTGNVDLYNVTVTDDKVAENAIHCPDDGNTDNRITLLPVGASAICTASGTAAAGQYANTGAVVGYPQEAPSVSSTDPSHYYGDNGAIDIEKATNGEDADTEPGPKITINRDVTWTYVVTNTGHLPLSQVTVTDDKEGAITCPKTTLAVGEAMTCTKMGKAVKGQYANIGAVTARTPDDHEVTDSDPSHYFGNSAWLLFLPPIISHCPPTPDYCYMIADGDNVDNTNSPLFKYIFKTNTLEMVNRLGVNDVETSTLSLDGQTLYTANNGIFGRVDLTSGKSNSFIPIGRIGKGRGSEGIVNMLDIDGMAIDLSTNILYATVRMGEGSDHHYDLLIQINTATGQLIPNAFGAGRDYVMIDTSLIGDSDIDDIAFNSQGVLFGVAGNSGGGGLDHLVIINKQTGAVESHGALNYNGNPVQDMEGLTYYNSSTLFGTTGTEFQQQGTANTLYIIHKDTGAVSPVSRLEQSFNGYIPKDFEAVSCYPICR